MKKRIPISAFLLSVALTSTLAGCNNSISSESNNILLNNSSEFSESVSDNSGNNSDAQTSTSQVQVDAETKALIDTFALDSFTAPDGNTVGKSEAVYAIGADGNAFAIGFDFSYMRYANQIFSTTFDDPSLINWETLEFKTQAFTPVDETNYFKVKAGDMLENGLKVETANYWVDSRGKLYSSEIVFYGDLTLDGILYCTAEDADYIDVQGDLFFFADTTKNSFIPIPKGLSIDFIENHVDTVDKFAVSFDGKKIHLGNINEVSVDLSHEFDSGNYIKAKVTMRGVRLMYNENGGALIYAEPVSVEKL